ncbi:MAG: PKD domain-containing protein [Pseudomonadota bacterium]
MHRNISLSMHTLFLLLASLWVTQVFAKTDLAWSEKPLTVSVMQGGAVSASAQVSIYTDLNDVYLEVVPKIDEMVRAFPDHFDVLQEGDSKSIDFLVSVPADALEGVHKGTLHFRNGHKTLAKPLKIVIHVTPHHELVADVGENLNGLVDTLITFNGDGSYDQDGDLISYAWSLVSVPTGSFTTLNDVDQYDSNLIPDVPGEYEIQLIVNDGKADSEPDRLVLTAWSGIAPPNADAGQGQQAQSGATVSFDGSGSSDPQELPLTYRWIFSSVPLDSTLCDTDISLSHTVAPYFIPDVEGMYNLELHVSNGTASDTDSIRIIVAQPNLAPVANAGPDRAAKTGRDAGLNGNTSYDQDSGPADLSYRWILVSRPIESSKASVDITNADSATPGFIPDVFGSYVFRLEVSDGDKTNADNVVMEVEDTAPVIAIISPIDGSTVDTPRTVINVEYSDAGTGIEPSSFYAEINGTDYSDDFSIGSTSAVLQPTFDLPAGINLVTATIEDRAGNLAIAQSSFNVAYFRAIPGAIPVTGDAPLTVYFSTDKEDPNETIEIFRWDFEGDGVYDTYDTVVRDYSYTYNAPGTYSATLHVWSSTGETTSASVEITVLDNTPVTPPDLSLITISDPGTGIVTVVGDAGSVEAGALVTLVNYETGATAVITADSNGAFSVSLAAVDGDVFRITVSDSSGNTSMPVSESVGQILSLDLISPLNSTVIDDDTVFVTGTYSGPPNTAISVNGVIACTDGTSFSASNVRLEPGVNTLVAYATMPDGLFVSETIEVTSSGPAPVQVRVEPPCGLAPHTVEFFITNNTLNVMQSVELDFDNDGQVDQLITDLSTPIEHDYTVPGNYSTAVTVYDDQGNHYGSIHPVIVTDITIEDAKLRSVYLSMLDRLRAGSIAGALNNVTGGVYAKYREIFQTLTPDLQTIVDQLGDLSTGAIGTDMAEYVVTRSVNGEQKAFPIYLLRSEDGVWRIDGM